MAPVSLVRYNTSTLSDDALRPLRDTCDSKNEKGRAEIASIVVKVRHIERLNSRYRWHATDLPGHSWRRLVGGGAASEG